MKSYSSIKTTKSRRISSKDGPVLIIVAFFIPLFLFLWLWPSLLSSIASPIITPLLKGEASIRAKLKNSPPSDTNVDQVELDKLREENLSLKGLMANGEGEEERIAAGVIGRPTNLPYDVLVIDKGSADGVIENAPIYAGEELVIGLVAKVYDHSAVVALITTPGWRSTVYIYGPNIYTTAVGQGSGIARVHVPQGVEIAPGNPVVVPSLSGGVYGNIFTVDSVPSRPEQYGYVAIETPINSLRLVAVGRRPLTSVSFDEAKEIINQTRGEILEVKLPEGVLIEADSDIASSSATSTEESVDGPSR